MSEVNKVYQGLWEQAYRQFQRNEFELDLLIDSADDSRRGITCLARFENKVISNIEGFLEEAKRIEPTQYYYPRSDFHLTVMSIITCYEGFTLDSIEADEYVRIMQECASLIKPFKIRFEGITASSSCIMLQGFPETDDLSFAREFLRKKFKDSGLESTIDSRYLINTAHSTVLRFRAPIVNRSNFVKLLNDYRDYDFGITEVGSFELVFNDWYQKLSQTKTLFKESLKK